MKKLMIIFTLLIIILPFAASSDSFNFNLYNQVAKSEGNVILSPFSVKIGILFFVKNNMFKVDFFKFLFIIIIAMSMCGEGDLSIYF